MRQWNKGRIEGRNLTIRCRADGPDGPRPELKRYALERDFEVKRLKLAFAEIMYVQVGRDTVRVKNIKTGQEVHLRPDTPFSSARLLISDFEVAEKLLTDAVRQVHKGIFPPSPVVVIHPTEGVEGGVGSVERRVLTEVAEGAGASLVVLWLGQALSDQEVMRMVEDAV